ncbi:MAG: hypothetical protein WCK35_16495 [Chloroflexota bacterium]
MESNQISIFRVRTMMDQIANNLQEHRGYLKDDNSLAERVLQWFLGKQEQYRHADYLEKFQDQAVYLHEGSLVSMDIAREFLCRGYPVLSNNEVDSYISGIRQNAFQTARDHQNYIRKGCNGCDSHQNHNRYKGFYELRRSGNNDKYLEEIEFSAIAYQMEFTLADGIASYLLLNGRPGIARSLNEKEVQSLLEERLQNWTMIFGKIIVIGNTPDPSKTSWREIWAKELKKLSKNSLGSNNSRLVQ